MKKILLSLGVFTSLTINAQTLVNGDFEATMTESAVLPGFFTTDGWGGWLFSPDSVTPIAGAQSVKLETKQDAALHAYLGWDANMTYAGYIAQSIRQTVTAPEYVVLDFDYRYIKSGVDSAYIEISIIDTMAAGGADDVTLFYNYILVGESTTGVVHAALDMIPSGQTGSANRLSVYAVSSIDGWFNDVTPSVGSILTLDNMILSSTASVENIDDNELKAMIFPNPATNLLNFKMNANAKSIEIKSLDGKSVLTSSFNASTGSIDISNLESGMYIYVITAENGAKTSSTFVKK